MINVKEIMIGNYVEANGIIFKIMPQHIMDIYNKNSIYNPIPLTPEILEKSGFEYEYKSEFTIRLTLVEDARFGYDWNKTYGWRLRYLGEHFSEIKYIHKVQNLIYALTGKELPINL